MRSERYVIECRTPEGHLDFDGRQPENVFGYDAIHGIDEDKMAKGVWREVPDATLDGRHILQWPAFIDPRWVARRKTW